ncbi:unnamed protein product [Aureobasidium vineae]|uniref:C2 domain protein n=1 Tax=Aureobasidium vineae TaxID=2773715 RepID=A0A9N8JAZ8_9PEZI|nr:unnamed protein product [Aureobasidium vineae]
MADAQQQHAPGGHYSGSNKIPTINQFIERLDRDKVTRDKQIEEQKKAQISQKNGDAVPHQQSSGLHAKENQQKVTDPTTGKEVVIEDVNKEMVDAAKNPMLSVPNANLGKPTSMAEYKHNQDVTAPPDPVAEGSTSDVPIHGEKTNILFHPTPSVSYEPFFAAMEKRATGLCIGVFLGIVFVGNIFGGRLLGLIPLAMCVASGVFLWAKEVIRSGREVEWDTEKIRGRTATANLLPESVEWMNTLLGIVWGLVNPDMFQSVADTLEDVMQASVPGIIENVRVAEINQGSNPIRILSLRALPDEHMKEMKQAIHEENKKTKDPQEAAADEEGGDYYNLEVSFAYHAAPSGKRASDRARNMHMQLVFYLGIKGLFGVPLPIFVELQELVGTVRLRMAMTPEPPFLKTLTFTLMGVPHVQAGCIPMVEKGVNILNLPLISNFVNYAIGAAASMYVAPKSMSLDMRAMLQGDDITKDVQALGVMWIRIHRAVGLSKQDKRGSKYGGSDPYITLSFSKYGKPMYCTRVITDDLNPIWEETAAVELWDSDRHTADDIVGKVELSMQKMIQHPGKMYPQVSKLAGMDSDSEMPGELHWEVGFFGKPQFRPALRTDGKNHGLPQNLRDKPELQDDKGVANTETDDAVQHTPPDPLWPSGVCSIVVHQIVNLELDNIKGTEGSRKGREYEPAKPSGEGTDEEGDQLPTSYCTILYNDELVYRTRAKAVSSQPIFNAGTERFVRDWRSAVITVTVRDSRNREHDPILGVVPLKLSDVMETSSQLKMRTGGSIGKLPRTQCHKTDNGLEWEVQHNEKKDPIRLPVKYRYRSPIVFEFHLSGKRKADAHAVLWLQHLVDNESTEIDIPIWRTSAPARLTQNYITEDNATKAMPGLDDLEEVGRLKFTGRFKAGMDESHEHFVADNESRETYETWEACLAEGVRTRLVEKEMPDRVQALHEKSLTEGRDILKEEEPDEKQKWLSKQGTDWSGAFGEDPKAYVDSQGRKRREPGAEPPLHDPHNPSSDDDSDSGDDSSNDLGIMDADNSENRGGERAGRKSFASTTGGRSSYDSYAGTNSTFSDPNTGGSPKSVNAQNKRTEERKQRGLMQWKPARNLKFAKDEGKIGLRKIKNKLTGGLNGRQPGVETETGT